MLLIRYLTGRKVKQKIVEKKKIKWITVDEIAEVQGYDLIFLPRFLSFTNDKGEQMTLRIRDIIETDSEKINELLPLL